MVIEGEELHLKGFPICKGIAIGRPLLFIPPEEKVAEITVSEEEVEHEVARYHTALRHSRDDLLSLKTRVQSEGGLEAADILTSHLEILHDPLMTTHVEEKIREKRKNTEYVFKMVMGEYEHRLNTITNLFFREKVKDFQDISRRIIAHLRNKQRISLSAIATRSIVFAQDLCPSDTAEANVEYIEAFVTRSGAETSHVAIMARARGIPFVTNIDFPDFSLSIPPLVIVDGGTGEVIINPSKKTLEIYKHKVSKKAVMSTRKLGAIETADGLNVTLSANVETLSEVESVAQRGAAVGLFRSEYLFFAKGEFPTEEEQFVVYKTMVEKLAGKKAVIRTFDLGGDKLGRAGTAEKNPFLGCRGIRWLLKEKALFKAQLRALLRASAFGNLSLLFPLITGVEELHQAKAVLEEAKQELREEHLPFAPNLLIGCMIEVPSAALVTDLLAKSCAFLSLGTNDLVQYTLAVDRGNAALSYLYSPAHPSVLRLLRHVITHSGNLPLSVCGEMAADPRYLPLLLGLGVKEFSVASPALPAVADLIARTSYTQAKHLADKALTLTTAEEVKKILECYVN